MQHNNYYGKYRAIVTQVEGKNRATRIKVKCPDVLGDSPSAWCIPCIPFIVSHKVAVESGGYALPLNPPKVGEPVWIEFEGGDLSKPIWVGTWR